MPIRLGFALRGTSKFFLSESLYNHSNIANQVNKPGEMGQNEIATSFTGLSDFWQKPLH